MLLLFKVLHSPLGVKLLQGHKCILYFCFIAWLPPNGKSDAKGLESMMWTMAGNWYPEVGMWPACAVKGASSYRSQYSSWRKSKADFCETYNKAIVKDKSSKLRQNKNVLSSGTKREWSVSPNISHIRKHWGIWAYEKQAWTDAGKWQITLSF